MLEATRRKDVGCMENKAVVGGEDCEEGSKYDIGLWLKLEKEVEKKKKNKVRLAPGLSRGCK